MNHHIVTIDGPSGTGKSSVARQVAQKTGFLFLDTGALYRAAALAIEEAKGDPDNQIECAGIIGKTSIEIKNGCVWVNKRDVTSQIRMHHISGLASRIAIHPEVRATLTGIQRSIASNTNIVAEGRDTGSVVFPHANIKIFMDADARERALRRYRELTTRKKETTAQEITAQETTYDAILKAIKDRDKRDSTRSVAPLIIPEDAIVLDTTDMSLKEVVEQIIGIIKKYPVEHINP